MEPIKVGRNARRNLLKRGIVPKCLLGIPINEDLEVQLGVEIFNALVHATGQGKCAVNLRKRGAGQRLYKENMLAVKTLVYRKPKDPMFKKKEIEGEESSGGENATRPAT